MKSKKLISETDDIINNLVSTLKCHQLDDGGFKGYHLFDKVSGIWSTVEILQILAKTNPKTIEQDWAVKSSKYIVNFQNADGGWGFRGGGKSVVDVTAWACLAVSHFGYKEEVLRGIEFLLFARKNVGGVDRGGWGLTTNEPDRIYSTTIASNCLNRIITEHSDWFTEKKKSEIYEAIKESYTWIVNSKNHDGGWGALEEDDSNVTSSAIALISIFSQGQDPRQYRDTFEYIKNSAANGLWQLEREIVVTQEGYELTQEWFTTMYCFRAFIFFAELRICEIKDLHSTYLSILTLLDGDKVKPSKEATSDLIWTLPLFIEGLSKFRLFVHNNQKQYEDFLYYKEIEEQKHKKLEIEKLLKTLFPYPISQVYFSFSHEIDFHRKFQYLVQLYEVLVKYTAVVALSSVIASNEKIAQLTQLVESRFKKPSLGDWVRLTESIITHSDNVGSIIYPWSKNDLIKSQPNFLDPEAPKLNLNQAFSSIVSLRNNWTGHGAVKSLFEYKMVIDEHLPLLFSLLNRLLFLAKCNSFLILSSDYNEFGDGDIYKIRVFNGLDVSDDDLEIQKRLSEGQRENLIRYVYFHNIESNTIVNLYPFLSYMYCSDCKKERFFFFNSVNNKNTISYLSFECGHSTDSNNLNHFTKRFAAVGIEF